MSKINAFFMRYAVSSLLLLAVLAFALPAAGQEKNTAQTEDSLVNLADSMLHGFIPQDRLDFGFEFAKKLKEALAVPNSFNNPFSKLSGVIHILQPEDKSFRIFNWLIAPNDYMRRYYGVIQMADGTIYPLINYADRFTKEDNLATASLDRKHWYGCAYYKIKTVEAKGRKYYCLMGVNTDGLYSNKKVLDVLTFTKDGPRFGAPIFMVPGDEGLVVQPQSRFILEYKKTAQCNLNYDDSRNMILFDRLRSDIYDPDRKNTYTPTGQVDGLRWTGGSWVFVEEAIPVLRLKNGEAPIDGVLKK